MVKRFRLQKGVYMMCTPFRKGIDKEMGMMGMDAMHPEWKVMLRRITPICQPWYLWFWES